GIKEFKYQIIGSPYLDEWLTITTNATDQIMSAIQNVGDLNGDGYADLAYSEYSKVGEMGKVFIFFGGPAMNAEPDIMISGISPRFGMTLSGTGDVNGDGIADLFIGDPFYSAQGKLN